jgi:hypothetical protein
MKGLNEFLPRQYPACYSPRGNVSSKQQLYTQWVVLADGHNVGHVTAQDETRALHRAKAMLVDNKHPANEVHVSPYIPIPIKRKKA